MSEALYDLAIIRHSSVKPVEQLVQDLLEIMEETGDSYLEYKLSEALLFEQTNNAILESITLQEGQRCQQLFLEQEVETQLNPASQTATHKLEKSQIEDLVAEEFHTGDNETELSDEETPGQSTFKKKKQKIIAVAGAAAVLVTGAAGYFIFEEFNKSTEQELQQLASSPGHKKADGIQGKDAPLSQTKIQKSAVTAEIKNTTTKQETTTANSHLSPQQLKTLTTILKSTESKTFGHTDSGQYLESRPKLNRLLELDKPSLGLVFAENIDDSYSAALLILVVANSEQQKKRDLHHDEVLLTMKSIAIQPDSEHTAPLLTSALSQIHTITGDNAAAEKQLGKAIQEAENTATTPEQNIQWLTRMLIDHQHFNHSTGAEKLINKLESIASNTPVDTPENHLTVSSIYSHLASIAISRGDMMDATRWLKKIPVKKTREHLQAYFNGT